MYGGHAALAQQALQRETTRRQPLPLRAPADGGRQGSEVVACARHGVPVCAAVEPGCEVEYAGVGLRTLPDLVTGPVPPEHEGTLAVHAAEQVQAFLVEALDRREHEERTHFQQRLAVRRQQIHRTGKQRRIDLALDGLGQWLAAGEDLHLRSMRALAGRGLVDHA